MARVKLQVGNPGRILFYRTQPIDEDARSGSALRPAKLLDAFRRLGYEVDVVAGYAAARRAAIATARSAIGRGVRYDFLYAEPPTTPIPLNEPHHLPIHPFLDYGFLSFCHSHRVPVVLFYCDVQWTLAEYARRLGWAKYLAVLPFFHLDLAVFRRTVDVLLVPDLGYLAPISRHVSGLRTATSTPGFDPAEHALPHAPPAPGAGPRLLYVGGIEPPMYDLTQVLEGSAMASRNGSGHTLTICCREPEWARRPRGYDRLLGPHVTVVHNRTRRELLELYARHDVSVMPFGTRYWDWGLPTKFAESVGLGVPVVAGAGTAVGKIVAEQGIGWCIECSPVGFADWLRNVGETQIEHARAAVGAVRQGYSWDERAAEIAAIAGTVHAREPAVRPA